MAFTHVTVVDVRIGRLQPEASIVVRGDRITAVDRSERVKLPDGATVVRSMVQLGISDRDVRDAVSWARQGRRRTKRSTKR